MTPNDEAKSRSGRDKYFEKCLERPKKVDGFAYGGGQTVLLEHRLAWVQIYSSAKENTSGKVIIHVLYVQNYTANFRIKYKTVLNFF